MLEVKPASAPSITIMLPVPAPLLVTPVLSRLLFPGVLVVLKYKLPSFQTPDSKTNTNFESVFMLIKSTSLPLSCNLLLTVFLLTSAIL